MMLRPPSAMMERRRMSTAIFHSWAQIFLSMLFWLPSAFLRTALVLSPRGCCCCGGCCSNSCCGWAEAAVVAEIVAPAVGLAVVPAGAGAGAGHRPAAISAHRATRLRVVKAENPLSIPRQLYPPSHSHDHSHFHSLSPDPSPFPISTPRPIAGAIHHPLRQLPLNLYRQSAHPSCESSLTYLIGILQRRSSGNLSSAFGGCWRPTVFD